MWPPPARSGGRLVPQVSTQEHSTELCCARARTGSATSPPVWAFWCVSVCQRLAVDITTHQQCECPKGCDEASQLDVWSVTVGVWGKRRGVPLVSSQRAYAPTLTPGSAASARPRGLPRLRRTAATTQGGPVDRGRVRCTAPVATMPSWHPSPSLRVWLLCRRPHRRGHRRRSSSSSSSRARDLGEISREVTCSWSSRVYARGFMS